MADVPQIRALAGDSALKGGAPAAGAREFPFTKRDFDRVRGLIHARAGIALAPAKRDMVYSRLVRRVRALRQASFAGYLDFLESPHGAGEWEAFTNALTTNLTAFFREAHHFDALRAHLATLPRGRRASIWSAASSTGEEPYSIAITAAEHYRTLHPPVSILATDLDTNVLQTGRRGIYPLERVEKLSRERLKRFFHRGHGENEGWCRVIPELQALVEFRRLNLLERAWGAIGPFDVIFCRNVLIYFDKPTQREILARMAALLQPDGLLFAGHSESLFHVSDLFESRGRTVYRRAGGAA